MKVRLPLLCLALACIAGLVALVWAHERTASTIDGAFVLGGVCAGAVSRIWTWSDES